MKRFFLFQMTSYYPAGGMSDFVDDFETLEEAKAEGDHRLNGKHYDWVDILDTKTEKMLSKQAIDPYHEYKTEVNEWHDVKLERIKV